MRAILVVLVVTVAGAVSACSDERSSGGLEVVASFYPLAEAVSRVGGDRVDVVNLTPPGVEPHDMELNADQVDAIEDADVVLYVGGFQPLIDDIAGDQGRAALNLTPAGADPHFWLDPTQMASGVDKIAAALADAAPDDAEFFTENAAKFKAQLATLDADFRKGLRECTRRDIVVSHEAFHHLASRYGLTQVAISGMSPEAEPDAARIGELTDVIRARGITTVFFEELVPRRVADTLAREAKVETAVLSPVEAVPDDDADEGRDYLKVMRENLAALRKALDCR